MKNDEHKQPNQRTPQNAGPIRLPFTPRSSEVNMTKANILETSGKRPVIAPVTPRKRLPIQALHLACHDDTLRSAGEGRGMRTPQRNTPGS